MAPICLTLELEPHHQLQILCILYPNVLSTHIDHMHH